MKRTIKASLPEVPDPETTTIPRGSLNTLAQRRAARAIWRRTGASDSAACACPHPAKICASAARSSRATPAPAPREDSRSVSGELCSVNGAAAARPDMFPVNAWFFST